MSTEETVSRLVHRLWIVHDQEPVYQELIAIGEPAVEPLIALLNTGEGMYPPYAALALGRLGNARAIPPLFTKMQSDMGPLGALCIHAIGQIGDPSAVEPLLAMMANAEELVEQHIEQFRAQAKAKDHGRFRACSDIFSSANGFAI